MTLVVMSRGLSIPTAVKAREDEFRADEVPEDEVPAGRINARS